MTFRELRLLEYGDLIVGPNNTIYRFLKHTSFVRNKATYIELEAVPSRALESSSIHNLVNSGWYVPNSAQIKTIRLLFNPLDDAF